ncbi:MAG TPA: BsuPI-related putative proteinase inhibitor, partial [Candidatus Acidoferrales bacterium]|nr:BsuPI-related putative proteinase inhibitor [Candidatus Acidoferrales bacterium]
VAHNTPPAATSPWVMPGQYTVRLTADGKSYTQPLTVKMDPRVKTPLAGLQQQFTLSKQLCDDAEAAAKAIEEIRIVRAQLQKAKEGAGSGAQPDAITVLDKKLADLVGTAGGGFGGGAGQAADTLNSVRGSLQLLMGILQGADVAPTTQAVAAITARRKAMAALLAKWKEIKTKDVPAVTGAPAAGTGGGSAGRPEGSPLEQQLKYSLACDAAQPGKIAFAFNVMNPDATEYHGEARTSQIFDISVFLAAGETDQPVWQWSKGKMFAQMITPVTIAAGKNWKGQASASIKPGQYKAIARFLPSGGTAECTFEVRPAR